MRVRGVENLLVDDHTQPGSLLVKLLLFITVLGVNLANSLPTFLMAEHVEQVSPVHLPQAGQDKGAQGLGVADTHHVQEQTLHHQQWRDTTKLSLHVLRHLCLVLHLKLLAQLEDQPPLWLDVAPIIEFLLCFFIINAKLKEDVLVLQEEERLVDPDLPVQGAVLLSAEVDDLDYSNIIPIILEYISLVVLYSPSS